MGKPKISVIIPTYNRANVIGQSIESVLTQTYDNIELIVVDDGSTDDTHSVLAKYGDKVKVIEQPNGGVSKARNEGLRVASGDDIGFLDSDDYYLPNKIEEQVIYLDNHPEVDIALCNWLVVSAQDTTTSTEYKLQCQMDDILNSILWKDVCGLFPVHTPLFKRQCLEQVSGFDPFLRIREEQDFWLRMALAGFHFGMVEEILCVYIDSPHSKGKNLDRIEGAMIYILDKVFSHPALPAETALLRDEIYARIYLRLVRPMCNRSNLDKTGKIETARKYAYKSFQNNPDITSWRKDTILPLLNLALEIDCNDPASVLLSILSDINDKNLCANLLSRLYVALAFRAYSERNRVEVIKHILKAFQKNTGIYTNRGARSIFVRSIIPLPLQPLKDE